MPRSMLRRWPRTPIRARSPRTTRSQFSRRSAFGLRALPEHGRLLALQKGPDEWVHRDELLFQVTHQASELWLKLCASDATEAVRLIEAGDLEAALRLLHRGSLSIRYVIQQLDMLEHMSPWEYQEIRKVLGHGSGFDSPGWNALRHEFPRLGQAFHAIRRPSLSLADVYVQGREHEDLYQLAEALIELDEQAQHWRLRHYQVVARVIGDKVVGTQGTPRSCSAGSCRRRRSRSSGRSERADSAEGGGQAEA